MKKNIFLVCLLAFLTTTAFSQNFDFGFGLTTGTKMKITETGTSAAFGANVRGVLNFAHKFGVLGGVSYYLPHTFGTTTKEKNSHLVLNADLIYKFISLPKAKIYGLAGIAHTKRYKKINDVDHNLSGTGFEFGAGAKLGPLFGEIKYETKFKNVIATVGIYLK